MKANRLIWALVALVVLTTISVTLGSLDGRSQSTISDFSQPTPPNVVGDELGRYAVAEYALSEAISAREGEERRIKGQRYDNWGFVKSKPSTDLFGASVTTEDPAPEAIPAKESSLIIVGDVANATAYLSADKGNVYTEFAVEIKEMLKNDTRKKTQLRSVTVDRAGGVVLYPNGHKMLYTVDGQDLPTVGRRYLFFLTRNDRSPNYQILTAYELGDDLVRALDTVRNPQHKSDNRETFIDVVRARITQLSENKEK